MSNRRTRRIRGYLKRLALTGVGLVALLFVVGALLGNQPQPTQSRELSVWEALNQCAPELSQFPNRNILASTTYRGQSYYIVATSQFPAATEAEEIEYGLGRIPPEKERYWEVVIALDPKKQCKLLKGREEFFGSLMNLMPRDLARQLALQRAKLTVKADGGIQTLQKKLNADAAGWNQPRADTYSLFPEDAWAYRQLGIKIPKAIPVEPEPSTHLR